MSEKESEGNAEKVKSTTHKGLGRLTDDRLGQVKRGTKVAVDKNKKENIKATKKRTHEHYHSHDISNHDHV